MTAAADAPRAPARAPAASLFLVVVVGIVWGCNWPVLKLGVTELAPLTFRGASLGFAGLALLAVARASGDHLRIPRQWLGRTVVLAMFNIAAWNALILFGVQRLPAGRSAILAYTMPLWSVLFARIALDERLSGRKALGLALGMLGMGVLVSEDLRNFARAPTGALLVVGAAMTWSVGTVLLRKWRPPIPQSVLTGWMLIIGWVPIAALALAVDPHAISSIVNASPRGHFAIAYNIFFAGTLAHWAWFRMARTLPVAVSSLSSLPVPVVGVVSGMLFLGERPGTLEFVALALVLASLAAVLLPERRR